MKSTFAKSALLSLLFCFIPHFTSAAPQALPSPTHYTIPSGDPAREDAEVFVPSAGSVHRRWPVVLLLHGYAGSGPLIDFYFGMSQAVAERGFILIVPNGKKDSSGYRFWNATEGCCDFDHTKPDDVTYLLQLLKKVESQQAVDPTRIAVVGHSNGGFMAHRLACEASREISTIASFAGVGFLDANECKAQTPVSVLQIHALDDDTIHYGGDVGYPGLKPYPGAVETVNQWLKRDGCDVNSASGGELNLTSSIPGRDTKTTRWNHCQNNSEVDLWTIQANALWHYPHTPLLRQDFTDRVLDFLLR